MCSIRVRYTWASDLGMKNTQSVYQDGKSFSLLNVHTLESSTDFKDHW